MQHHLTLIRRDVDVVRVRRHLEVEHGHRTLVRTERAVELVYRLGEPREVHRSAVDEEKLTVARAAAAPARRLGHEPHESASDPALELGVDGDHRLDGLGAEDGGDVLSHASVALGVDDGGARGVFPPALIRADDAHAAGHQSVRLEKGEELAVFAFEVTGELLVTHGERFEDAADRDGGAHGARDGLAGDDPASSVVRQTRGDVLGLGASGDGEFGERAEGGERLAAEAEGVQGEQVVEGVDLGRGVLLRESLVVLGGDPRAVVHHLDGLRAVVLESNLNVRRAGVERVLDELLHRAGEVEHHLPAADAVDGILADGPDGARRGGARGVRHHRRRAGERRRPRDTRVRRRVRATRLAYAHAPARREARSGAGRVVDTLACSCRSKKRKPKLWEGRKRPTTFNRSCANLTNHTPG